MTISLTSSLAVAQSGSSRLSAGEHAAPLRDLRMGRPPATAATAKSARRRAASIALAIGIQGAFVALLLSTMGVKAPAKIGPMMVVDIMPEQVQPKDVAPPPPTIVTPVVEMTLPVVPDTIVEVPPPAVTAAITVAQKGTPAADTPRAAPETYETLMLRYINSHLRYPVSARHRHQQGVVLVRFMMDRHGHVLSSVVERSSRVVALDEESLALLARADPLPPPPATIKGDPLQLILPINFALK